MIEQDHFFQFQFQCGAIEGDTEQQSLKLLHAFQFQCGAIEGTGKSSFFNALGGFQFQCGAIEGVHCPKIPPLLARFQFQCGAIEGLNCTCIYSCGSAISIPVWCDWGGPSSAHSRSFRAISIPVWCDWGWLLFGKGELVSHDFNSSVVRLRVAALPADAEVEAHFNSSVVRLRV